MRGAVVTFLKAPVFLGFIRPKQGTIMLFVAKRKNSPKVFQNSADKEIVSKKGRLNFGFGQVFFRKGKSDEVQFQGWR
jgi:hypothetical protein